MPFDLQKLFHLTLQEDMLMIYHFNFFHEHSLEKKGSKEQGCLFVTVVLLQNLMNKGNLNFMNRLS